MIQHRTCLHKLSRKLACSAFTRNIPLWSLVWQWARLRAISGFKTTWPSFSCFRSASFQAKASHSLLKTLQGTRCHSSGPLAPDLWNSARFAPDPAGSLLRITLSQRNPPRPVQHRSRCNWTCWAGLGRSQRRFQYICFQGKAYETRCEYFSVQTDLMASICSAAICQLARTLTAASSHLCCFMLNPYGGAESNKLFKSNCKEIWLSNYRLPVPC